MARAWRFGDSVNTDQIIPGRFNVTTDPVELGRACFIELRPEFAQLVAPGDVIVAGPDFGCGSSREHAVIALQAAGIGAVFAPSYGRIFYRNAVNRGLPVLECPDCTGVEDLAEVHFDPSEGTLRDLGSGRTLRARPLPEFAERIARHGGVLELVRAHGSLRGECGPLCTQNAGTQATSGGTESVR